MTTGLREANGEGRSKEPAFDRHLGRVAGVEFWEIECICVGKHHLAQGVRHFLLSFSVKVSGCLISFFVTVLYGR